MTEEQTLVESLEGRARVWIERVTPQLDGGRYPIKRVVGERVVVEARVFADGHDHVAAVIRYRPLSAGEWREAPLRPLGNDRWQGDFEVDALGSWSFSVAGWIDPFATWCQDLRKKVAAGQDVRVELQTGAHLIEAAADHAPPGDATRLRAWASEIGDPKIALTQRTALAGEDFLAELVSRYAPRHFVAQYEPELSVTVDPVLARFSAWYEMFPRSCAPEPGRHGTFRDCEPHLTRIADLGFDVVYFPPVHPIGRAYRKGPNNNPECQPGDPGSPWGIGAAEGGHTSIHPELGTLDDFQRLVQRAQALGLEVALDIAFQCSPDHPYVHEHPEWFRHRPDGSIQYAENPPKKYQDIYPLDFECADWCGLWAELHRVFAFWIAQGVRLFRVDNPHTKAFRFWEWVIARIKAEHPEVIFLAEAFTRPAVMYALAKLGFTQSYNYFPWRNTKEELTEYFTELTTSPVSEFFRPNLWPNTPDILPQYLQYGGRAAFMVRLILAATLGASYGIYGPPFELCISEAREVGSEEYLNSEKYELKHWDLAAPGQLGDLIRLVNRIRRENPALQHNDGLRFHPVDNEQLLAYTKSTETRDNIVLVIVNLDPHHVQHGWLKLPLRELEIADHCNYQVHDLLTGARYLWHGERNYVELDPHFAPAHVFRLRQRVRTEHDFDYYV